MLPGPFVGWLATLILLLLLQFLIRYQKELVGKGIPFGAIAELIAYNLSYMVTLAVPMSMLIAVLTAFGRLADSRAYDAARSAGVSLPQLAWPVLVVAGLVSVGMLQVNNVVLPEANFRARGLWQDIRRSSPGFALSPGVFYEELNGYTILVERLPLPGRLEGITVFDYTEGADQRRTIRAERGRLESQPGDRVDLVLESGSVSKVTQLMEYDLERDEQVRFGTLRIRLDLSSFGFERSDDQSSYRTDRTTPTADMIVLVDSLDRDAERRQAELRAEVDSLLRQLLVPEYGRQAPLFGLPIESALPTPADTAETSDQTSPTALSSDPLAGLEPSDRRRVVDLAAGEVRSLLRHIEGRQTSLRYVEERADRSRVEIYKKYAVALACLVFALIAAPLALRFRRGGLAATGGVALAVFLFYWILLTQGEKYADRGFLEPWIGMWAANGFLGGLGLWLLLTSRGLPRWLRLPPLRWPRRRAILKDS
jgi:lipopolysaccharide export system permease protein